MKNNIMMICFKMQSLLSREEGQDLIEYAPCGRLIAPLRHGHAGCGWGH